MKIKSYFLVLLIFFSLSYANSYTQDDFENYLNQEELLKAIIKNFGGAVERHFESKLYLNPQSLTPINKGM